MISFLLNSALMSSVSLVNLKMLGELVQSGSARVHWPLMVLMATILVTSAMLQIHLLNMAMKFYDQLQVIPVYQTSMMILWILTGLVILDEKAFYSGRELLAIFGSAVVCCVGIRLLMMKRKLK